MWSILDPVQDRIGSWFVQWRPDGFSVKDFTGPNYDFFKYDRIILPIEIAGDGLRASTDRLVLKLDPGARLEILFGAPYADLERFKRRVSAEVLDVRRSPFGCSDCSAEAGRPAAMWDGTVCASCRQDYCRSSACLRRLKLEVLRNGTTICKRCGVENRHASVHEPERTAASKATTSRRVIRLAGASH